MNNQESSDNSSLIAPIHYFFKLIIQKLKEYRYPITVSFLMGLFCYFFAFANKLPNHDDIRHLFTKGATLESGRWGLKIMSFLFPNCSMPWFHGILTIALITFAICLIIRIFSVRSHLLQSLLAGMIISFPSLIGLFSYMFTSSSFACSFLLAVLAVYFISREKLIWYLPASLCCILSVSIYQAYISLTASLLVLILIKKVMFTEIPAKKLFLQGLSYVAFLALSLGIYWIITNILQSVLNRGMCEYAASALQGDSGIGVRLKNTFLLVPYILFYNYWGLVSPGLVRILHWICITASVFEILLWFFTNRDLPKAFLLLFLLVMLPMAMSCILLFTALNAIHTLVLYGFVSIYVLFAVMIQECSIIHAKKASLEWTRKILLNLAVLSMAVIPFLNGSIANQAYMNLYFAYESCHSLSTSLITQIHMLPGYTAETPVAILGAFPAAPGHDGYLNIENIAGTSSWATSGWIPDSFFRHYCGAYMKWADEDTQKRILLSPEFAAMPTYPENGYVAVIDGIVTVKLPEERP